MEPVGWKSALVKFLVVTKTKEMVPQLQYVRVPNFIEIQHLLQNF